MPLPPKTQIIKHKQKSSVDNNSFKNINNKKIISHFKTLKYMLPLYMTKIYANYVLLQLCKYKHVLVTIFIILEASSTINTPIITALKGR